MVNNANNGPVQIFQNGVHDINLALLTLSERLDKLEGLRGRALVYDRVRIDSPSVSTDAVDLQSILTQESRFRMPLVESPGIIVSTPGTSYAEVSQFFRQGVDWSDLTDPEARVIVRGWGTESGSAKGVALHDGTSTIAEVTWDGSTEATRTGAFTAVSLTADTSMRLYAKGSSATESLILSFLVVEVKVSIEVISV